jgi:acetyl-CoA carboxylase biotin carboxyl carrier protein
MQQQQIKAFIDAMSASDLDEMEFSQDGWTLRLVRRTAARDALPASGNEAGIVAGLPLAGDADADADADAGAPSHTPRELLAPLYGIVHLRQAPDAPPLVTPGQAVAAGQTLCLIEAMKTFVEVRAEADGIVSDLLVVSGQEVEAGQSLLRFA